MADARARLLLLRYWRLCAGLFVLALLVRIPGYVHQLFDPDEATIADQAITLRDGGRLYVDAIDRKPPLPTYIYDATFNVFHNVDLRPVHVVAALFLAIAGCAVASDVGLRTRAQRTWAGVLLVTGAVAFLPDSGQSANYAHFALAPGALAIVLARRRSGAAALLAGLSLAAAVMCRQTWLIGLLPAFVSITGSRRWINRAWFGSGFLAGLAVTLVSLPTREVWHWVFTSNQGFLLTGPNWSMVSVSFFGGLVLLLVLHLPIQAAAGHRVHSAGGVTAALRVDRDLWMWWATATIAWLSGFRFFAHYWLQSLPPLVLLAAPVIGGLGSRIRRSAGAFTLITTLVAVGAAFTPGAFRALPDPAPLARYVSAHTEPGQRVLVWGNFPEVLWRADRPIGGALVHSDFVTGVSGNRTLGWFTLIGTTPGADAAAMRSVRSHPPELVLDTSSANIRSYGDYPLTDFTALAEFVYANYTTVAQVDGVTIFRRLQK